MSALIILVAVMAISVLGASLASYRAGFRRGREVGYEVGRDLQRVADIQEQWRKKSARHGKDGRFVPIKGKVGA